VVLLVFFATHDEVLIIRVVTTIKVTIFKLIVMNFPVQKVVFDNQ
jgi:hypothetical protein